MHRRVAALTLTILLAIESTVPAAPAAAADDSVREGPAVLKPAEQRVGELVPDVAFTDLAGKEGRLSDCRRHKVTVVCMTGLGCPLAKKYAPVLAGMQKDYGEKGVAFLYVNPNAHESAEKMRAAAAEQGLARYVHDADGAIARALGATSSTDVFVLDSARTLVYRGAVDDQFGLGYALPEPKRRFLADAIDAALAAATPAVQATSSPGCVIEPGAGHAAPAGAKPPPVTYHNRVSRILQRHCIECHRPGESAPFELGSYADVKGHLAMIRKVVNKGIMPPWFADAKTGHWANDRSLPARDREDLLAWIAAGAPEGDAADAPVARAFAQGWRIGKPDAVFEVPFTIDVPARGTMPYRYVTVENPLTEDKWVQAAEVRVDVPEVVHHVLTFLAYPKDHPRAKDQPDYDGGVRGYFAGLVPNQGATTYPPDTAKFLPKGALLVFQIHYTPNGTATRDRPRVGLKFADRAPEHEVVTRGVFNRRFRIPPGHPNYEVSATHTFNGPARVFGFMPHAHVRGKAFQYELTWPDGRRQLLLDVPRYDFNWQLEYHLAEPLDVPAGSTLKATAWYDNSPQNPANPDPTKTVRFGDQTWEEMMIGYFSGHRLPGDSEGADRATGAPAP